MKVAIVYNRDSRRVINLFGIPNQEKIGFETIERIASGLRKGGHQVRAIEGDKDLIERIEQFMPRVLKGELPGLVFNVSYGIQGQARYTHVPSILEMVGVPYVGSGPLAHSLALDKVVAKMIFRQHNIPTPDFTLLESSTSPIPDIVFPLIVKPKSEAVSLGIKVVNDEDELRDGARAILEKYNQPVLVERYVEGREINIGLLGNNPPEALPPVELIFGEGGPAIYTYEDKKQTSGREIGWECPARLEDELRLTAVKLAQRSFTALGCYDFARVDMRLDPDGNLYVLEVNSLPSLGEHGSYTIAADRAGLDFDNLVCRLVDVASARYYGTPNPPEIGKRVKDVGQKVFSYLVERRDEIEKRVEEWTHISSRTSDPTGIHEANRVLSKFCEDMGLSVIQDLTDERAVWAWQTKAGLDGGTLLIGHLDVPLDLNTPSPRFRRDPEWIYGEGIGSSRAPLVCLQFALRALRSMRRLRNIPLGLLYYSDEGRDCRYSHRLIQQAASRTGQMIVLRPGSIESNVITQRRGWRKYRLTISGSPRRLGKQYKKRDVLRWTTSCLDEFAKLTSKESRIAVAAGEMRTEAHPQLLPHRTLATVLVSFLDSRKADVVEHEMRNILKNKDYQCRLELISDRPPMRRARRGDRLYRELKEIADEWEIPLDRESSLHPSVGGTAPKSKAVVCGVGPVARDIDTPQEAVLRISLMQRTLLLAQFLARQARNHKK